jgi:taurine dioxygenase
MSVQIEFLPLQDNLSFGSRIRGVTRENVTMPTVSSRIWQEFETRGLLVFEGIEQSSEMQLALSAVFGPLKNHPLKAVARAREDLAPGVINLRSADDVEATLVEIDGVVLHNWLPWHFDHSYNDELNRAGVLRPVLIVPEGGLTGFADGIDLYRDLPPALCRIDGLSALYTLDLLVDHMRFGKPANIRELRTAPAAIELAEMAKTQPRAIHPAVWTRASGEKVLHVGSLHCVGLKDHENPDGDALLQAVCQYIIDFPKRYFHRWQPDQMLVWDNWRMLHCVTGADPKYPRQMHRTTIKGDYGLGYFEGGARRTSEAGTMM